MAEASEIARRRGIPIEKFAMRTLEEPYPYEIRKTNGKCQFLNGNVCKIYSYRPIVCQFYPFELRSIEDLLEIKPAQGGCVGIGQERRLSDIYFRELAETAIKRLGSQRVVDTRTRTK